MLLAVWKHLQLLMVLFIASELCSGLQMCASSFSVVSAGGSAAFSVITSSVVVVSTGFACCSVFTSSSGGRRLLERRIRRLGALTDRVYGSDTAADVCLETPLFHTATRVSLSGCPH